MVAYVAGPTATACCGEPDLDEQALVVVARIVDASRNRPHLHRSRWEGGQQIAGFGFFAEPPVVVIGAQDS
jgi:hypothetical protein